jgi:hypothetical protein
MLRNLICLVAVLGVCFGLALAEPVKGKITKIDGGKVTLTTKDAGDKTYDVAKDVKVFKMDKKNKVAVDAGLKADELTNISGKGVNATVEVVDGKVTEIILGGKKK